MKRLPSNTILPISAFSSTGRSAEQISSGSRPGFKRSPPVLNMNSSPFEVSMLISSSTCIATSLALLRLSTALPSCSASSAVQVEVMLTPSSSAGSGSGLDACLPDPARSAMAFMRALLAFRPSFAMSGTPPSSEAGLNAQSPTSTPMGASRQMVPMR